jgi:hypothetical protein
MLDPQMKIDAVAATFFANALVVFWDFACGKRWW